MNQNLSETGILYSGLTQIPKALCNEKALFVLIATGLLAIAIVFVGAVLPGSGSPIVVTLLMPLTLLVILPAGISIAGLLLMDQACGQTPRPLRKAISDGIPAFLRILGIMLLSLVLTLAFTLFLSLLLFVCKLPAVGPVLYAVLFPVLAILAGLLYFGLMAGLSMACPAVWGGATIREALEMFWRIATCRAVELLANLFLLAALTVLAEFILASIVFAGVPIVLGTSASILGDSFRAGVFAAASGSMTDYLFALLFGSMIGLVLLLAAIMAMSLMGLNLIYLRITKNLPLPKAQEYARNPMTQSESKKEPIINPAPRADTTGSMGSNPGGSTPALLASPLAGTYPAPAVEEKAKTIRICPHCRTPAQPDDRFCGECGGNLQD